MILFQNTFTIKSKRKIKFNISDILQPTGTLKPSPSLHKCIKIYLIHLHQHIASRFANIVIKHYRAKKKGGKAEKQNLIHDE